MGAWNDEELSGHVGDADELRIAPLRSDGTRQHPRIIWVVRLEDDVYIRSVNGPDGAWFRGVQARHAGHISAGGSRRRRAPRGCRSRPGRRDRRGVPAQVRPVLLLRRAHHQRAGSIDHDATRTRLDDEARSGGAIMEFTRNDVETAGRTGRVVHGEGVHRCRGRAVGSFARECEQRPLHAGGANGLAQPSERANDLRDGRRRTRARSRRPDPGHPSRRPRVSSDPARITGTEPPRHGS